MADKRRDQPRRAHHDPQGRHPRRLGHLPLSRRRPAADVPRRAAADGDHQRQHRHRSGDREGRRRRARQCVAEGERATPTASAWCRPPAICSRNTTRLTPADDRNAKTNTDRAYWLGEITPRGIGLMIEAIEKKTIASAASCDAMLRMMRAQQAGAAPAQSLHHRPGRAQDRRLPAGARQRRRHHLRALGTDRRVVPRQRDHRQLRRSRRSHRPLRASNSWSISINEDRPCCICIRNLSLCLCVSVATSVVGAGAAAVARREVRPGDPHLKSGARPRPRRR